MYKYAKLFVQVFATIATAVVAALSSDDVVTSAEWVNVAIAGVGALAVFTAPNVPGAAYTKSILAALSAVLTVLSSSLVGGIQTTEIIQIGVAVVGSLFVYLVPNRGQTVSYDSPAGNSPISL